MARAYSQDLRDRGIEAVTSEGLSRRAAARRFGVSPASAIKWLQRFHRTGKRESAGTGGHRPSKVQPERAVGIGRDCGAAGHHTSRVGGAVAGRAGREGRHRDAVPVLPRRRDQLQKKVLRPPSRRGRISRGSAPAGSALKAGLIPADSCSWMRRGPRPICPAATHGRCPRGQRLRATRPYGHWQTLTFVAAPAPRPDYCPLCLRRPDQRLPLPRLCGAMPAPDPPPGR